jgi:hypothetical protein
MPAPHISDRLVLLRDTVPWATYALKSSPLSRRDALPALDRCNLFEERHVLGGCPPARSRRDGKKELSLSDDGSAAMFDNSPLKGGETPKDHTTDGRWHFDDASKRYTVTFDGETTDYLLIPAENACMLIKGTLGTADLRASWFTFAPQIEEETRDRERDTPGL